MILGNCWYGHLLNILRKKSQPAVGHFREFLIRELSSVVWEMENYLETHKSLLKIVQPHHAIAHLILILKLLQILQTLHTIFFVKLNKSHNIEILFLVYASSYTK